MRTEHPARKTCRTSFALIAALLVHHVCASSPDTHSQWPIAAGDVANTRYSALSEITTSNVANLKIAYTFSTGTLRGQEAAPIIANNSMYIVTPFPNTLFALSLEQPSGPLRWKFDANPRPSSQGVACCDSVNRGAAYDDGRVFFNTLDAQTVAVDANASSAPSSRPGRSFGAPSP